MALRGSLSEFELSEIFQLIARDSKTGQLVLSHADKEGFVIFHQGAVVAAGNDALNLQKMLFNYLTSIKQYSEEEFNELLYLCQGEMRLFSHELVNRQYISNDELTAVAQNAIEDLACSLFLWNEGHYRFDSIEKVDEYIISGVVFSADAITMEAMRRSDEWKRIQKYIGPETVFTHVQKSSSTEGTAAMTSPFSDPAGYVYSLVDGVLRVGQLCSKAIFFEYRIYEILFGLWQNSKIVPLTIKHTPPKTPSKEEAMPVSDMVVSVITILVALLSMILLFFGSYMYNTVVLRQTNLNRHFEKQELPRSQSSQKVRIAALYYRALEGKYPGDITQLVGSRLIDRRDAAGEK